MRLLLLIALAACADSAPEQVKIDIPDHKTVFECGGTGHVIGEWCFDGEATELSRLVGALCWPSKDDRFFLGPLRLHRPWCLYCCGASCGAGCNAYQGCYCPAP